MAEATSTKFNLPKSTTFIIMPLAFMGNDKRFKDLTNAYRFLLAEIYTANKAVKGCAKLTYEHFVQKFGMSRETVCGGFRKLEELGIIERLRNSRYKIKVKFNTSDYIIIDDYLHKKLWNVSGVQKRLPRSRIVTLGFLERMNSNPKTNGTFRSSQSRIGVAINLPRTTAGDSIRELALIGLINLSKADTRFKEACKRGLTLYTVSPELLAVKRCKPKPPPDEVTVAKAIFKQHDKKAARKLNIIEQWQSTIDMINAKEKAERKIAEFDTQLMQSEEYNRLKQRFKDCKTNFIFATLNSRDKLYKEQEEQALEAARKEFTAYLKAHDVPPDIIAGLTL